MSEVLWIVFAAVYLIALWSLGLSTLRKGHKVLFWFGIVFPLLWIAGALMPPDPSASGAGGDYR